MKNNSYLKTQLYHRCLAFVDGRIDVVKSIISEIETSLLSETKSSAGDKHETGRAMIQLEREKAGNQLAELLKTKAVLTRMPINTSQERVCMGSLVQTTLSSYFISISAGRIEIDDEEFFAISPYTPIGQLLMGKRINEEVFFRNETIQILDIS